MTEKNMMPVERPVNTLHTIAPYSVKQCAFAFTLAIIKKVSRNRPGFWGLLQSENNFSVRNITEDILVFFFAFGKYVIS